MKDKVKIIGIIFILVIIIILFGLIIYNINKKKEIDIDLYTQVYLYNLGESNIEIIKKDDSVVLINSGKAIDREDLIDELNKLNIYEIDYLVITDKDDKYIGNVSYLLDNYVVDYLYMSEKKVNSKLMDELNDKLVGSYTESIILNSNENIVLDNLNINIYPKDSLLVELVEGNNLIYLTSNLSSNEIDKLNKSTLIVGENKDILNVESKYYLLDKENNKTLKRDLKVFMNEKEFIIE